MKRTPLRSRRLTPRRKAPERVTHERRPKASAPPTTEQKRYWTWLRERGACEACGARLDLVIHHILPSSSRSDWNVALICAPCHNGRTDSVHLLGSEAKFQEHHNVDLVAISVARLKEYRNE